MDAYKSLHTLPLTEVKRIHQPELPRDLQPSSPASKALLDFDFTAPPLLESNTGIAEALMRWTASSQPETGHQHG